DGIERDSDPGVPNQVIYVDYNNDGAPEANEPQAVTNALGQWAIGALFPATYVVRLLNPNHAYTITSPASPTGSGDGYDVTRVTGGVIGYFNDFGVIQPSYVSGTVFDDRNANHIQDNGESGLSQWQVFIDINGNGISDIGEPY